MDDYSGLVSRRAALTSGFSAAEIEYLVRRGAWARSRKGIYLTADAADLELLGHRARAAQVRMGDRCVASHSTAARLHGLPVLNHGNDVFVTVPRETVSPRRYGDVVVREAGLPDLHVTRLGEVFVTTVERTVVDIARARWPEEGVIVADAALRKGMLNESSIRGVFATMRGWPGVRRARKVLAFADPLSESPLESLARWKFAEWNLPIPVLQREIRDVDGWAARADFLWEKHRVVGEADGLDKYTETDVLKAEKIRQERLEQLGYKVVRFTWNEVVHHPIRTITRLRRALGPASPGTVEDTPRMTRRVL